jgi:hypothetical protein
MNPASCPMGTNVWEEPAASTLSILAFKFLGCKATTTEVGAHDMEMVFGECIISDACKAFLMSQVI